MFKLFQNKNQVNSKRKTGKYAISNIDAGTKEDILALREDGLLPSAIAEELGITSDQVSKVIQLDKTKRARRTAEVGDDVDDPVVAAKKDLAAAKIQLEKDKLEFEREKLKAEQEDYFADDVQEAVESETDPLTVLAMSLMQNMNRPAAPPAATPIASYDVPTQENAHVPPPPPAQQELTEDQIQEILKRYPAEVKMLQPLPDDEILVKLQTYFPNLTSKTYVTALGCIKKVKVKK